MQTQPTPALVAPHKYALVLPIGGQDRIVSFEYLTNEYLYDLVPLEQFNYEMAKKPYRLVPLLVWAGLKAGDAGKNTLPEGFNEQIVQQWLLEESVTTEMTVQVYDAFERFQAFSLSAFAKMIAPVVAATAGIPADEVADESVGAGGNTSATVKGSDQTPAANGNA